MSSDCSMSLTYSAHLQDKSPLSDSSCCPYPGCPPLVTSLSSKFWLHGNSSTKPSYKRTVSLWSTSEVTLVTMWPLGRFFIFYYFCERVSWEKSMPTFPITWQLFSQSKQHFFLPKKKKKDLQAEQPRVPVFLPFCNGASWFFAGIWLDSCPAQLVQAQGHFSCLLSLSLLLNS
jgi:hypothetical protein